MADDLEIDVTLHVTVPLKVNLSNLARAHAEEYEADLPNLYLEWERGIVFLDQRLQSEVSVRDLLPAWGEQRTSVLLEVDARWNEETAAQLAASLEDSEGRSNESQSKSNASTLKSLGSSGYIRVSSPSSSRDDILAQTLKMMEDGLMCPHCGATDSVPLSSGLRCTNGWHSGGRGQR